MHVSGLPRKALLPKKYDLPYRETPDKVIPMCLYALQTTQKCPNGTSTHTLTFIFILPNKRKVLSQGMQIGNMKGLSLSILK